MAYLGKVFSERWVALVFAALATLALICAVLPCLRRSDFFWFPLAGVALVVLTLGLPRLGSLGQFLVILAAIGLGVLAFELAIACRFAMV